MITVFDDTQRSHAPREFIVSGKPKPIPERPERIDMLIEWKGFKHIVEIRSQLPLGDLENHKTWNDRRRL